jgi:hypothetical protein
MNIIFAAVGAGAISRYGSGAKMAVILGWSGSEGLSIPGNTEYYSQRQNSVSVIITK